MCSSVPQSAGTTYGPIKNNTSQLLEQVRSANTAAQPPTVILHQNKREADYTINPDANEGTPGCFSPSEAEHGHRSHSHGRGALTDHKHADCIICLTKIRNLKLSLSSASSGLQWSTARGNNHPTDVAHWCSTSAFQPHVTGLLQVKCSNSAHEYRHGVM